MANGSPDLIAIDHDDFYAAHIGYTPEGHQFFLTTPFIAPDAGHEGSEFVALYLFTAAGDLMEARIDDFGPRSRMDKEARKQCCEQHLRDLGQVAYGRIQVKPFVVERFGAAFGLVVREPEDEDDVWAVELEPGNYMAFFEPWDSGLYDT
jgi:hypothetical protein